MDTKGIEKLNNFILNQLEALGDTAVSNYKNNDTARENNPFLCFSKGIDKFMGLGRSIDSQLGSRMQNIVFYLSRLRYGEKYVPNIILIAADKKKSCINLIFYYTTGDLSIDNFYSNKNPCQQKIYFNQEFSDETIRTIIGVKKKKASLINSQLYTYKTDSEIIDIISSIGKTSCPVDLLFVDTKQNNFVLTTFEIKMSGYIDTKNAESNAKEVQRLFDYFSFINNHLSYFAVCYGECADSVKNKMKTHAVNGSTLTAVQFWNKVLPNNGTNQLNYNDFIEIYKQAFFKSGIEKKIKSL